MADVTRLLDDLAHGRKEASDELFSLVYQQLRGLAVAYLRTERPDHTLQPTALVHEAYVRMVESGADRPQTRAHFQALASRIMRNILVDHARGVRAQKRGGDRERVPLANLDLPDAPSTAEVLEIDALLRGLAELNPRTARVVELRFFGGLTNEAIATTEGVSLTSVERDWRFARAWLIEHWPRDDQGPSSP